MTSPPLVSVIVLNFNGARIVGKCLDHLLGQTYPHVEIVVVDNGSTDESLAILDAYRGRSRITVVESPTNRGVAGGRNLGVQHAGGEVVAFMDNDGYAHPTWLAEAVRTLESDRCIGAVASLVFFNRRKIILNGAGGTLNYRGYGGDFCFNAPYEFARLPGAVLYPMGCGMVIRRAVLEAIGPLDELLFNYYDDVELGIRVWQAGFRVVLAADAWVDHDFSYSDEINQNKLLLCERNRIRTVLKYYPAGHLLRWLAHEVKLAAYLRSASLWMIPFKAWGWNIRHVSSALHWRRRFAGSDTFWHLLHPSWGFYPPPHPNNQGLQPVPARATALLALDRAGDGLQLNFGWYPPERDAARWFRWSADVASTIVRLPPNVRRSAITWRALRPDQQVRLLLRPFGELAPIWQACEIPGLWWEERRFPCAVAPGLYELLLHATPVHCDASGRELGVGVASIEFTE